MTLCCDIYSTAYKQPRFQQASRIARELKIWACLRKHRNILPFLGFMLHEGLLCSVSEWMENGNIIDYLTKNDDVDRVIVVCVSSLKLRGLSLTLEKAKGVASGLEYIHNEGIVHSDLKGVRAHYQKITPKVLSIITHREPRYTEQHSRRCARRTQDCRLWHITRPQSG